MPVLRPGEQTHFQCEARLRGTLGVLTITNQRIVVSRFSGLVSKRESTVLDLPLLAVQRTAVEERAGGSLLAIDAAGEGYTGSPRIELGLPQPVETERLIQGLVAARRRELSMQGGPPAPAAAPQVNVTIHQAPIPVPPPQIMVRCTHCRTVFAELDAKCPSCGASF
jgi:hypothetical protein